MYIFPFNNGEESELGSFCKEDAGYGNTFQPQNLSSNYTSGSTDCELEEDNKDGIESGNKPTTFEVSRVNQLMQQLEGKLLSYKMFARDTKASRNV